MLRLRAAVDWCIPLARGMRGLGSRYVIKFIEGSVDVVIYGYVNSDFGVVPFQVDSTEKGVGQVNCEFIVGLDFMNDDI